MTAGQPISGGDWAKAPKDGRKLRVTFVDGTSATAVWNAQLGDWQVARAAGVMLTMRYEHGRSAPIFWMDESLCH